MLGKNPALFSSQRYPSSFVPYRRIKIGLVWLETTL